MKLSGHHIYGFLAEFIDSCCFLMHLVVFVVVLLSSYLVQFNLWKAHESQLTILVFRKDLLQLGAGNGDLVSLFGGSVLIYSPQIQFPQLVAFTKHSLPSPVLILQFTLRVSPDFVFLLFTHTPCPPHSLSSFGFILLLLFHFFLLPFKISLTSPTSH